MATRLGASSVLFSPSASPQREAAGMVQPSSQQHQSTEHIGACTTFVPVTQSQKMEGSSFAPVMKPLLYSFSSRLPKNKVTESPHPLDLSHHPQLSPVDSPCIALLPTPHSCMLFPLQDLCFPPSSFSPLLCILHTSKTVPQCPPHFSTELVDLSRLSRNRCISLFSNSRSYFIRSYFYLPSHGSDATLSIFVTSAPHTMLDPENEFSKC